MEQSLPQLFGIIPTGLPCLTQPTSAPSSSSYIYRLLLAPGQKPFSHLTIFLLPGITLPPDTAAAVYISLPPSNASNNSNTPTISSPPPQFRFLGAIGTGKESAVFKISGLFLSSTSADQGEVDMDADTDTSAGGEVTVGISLEAASSVAAQMATLQQQQTPNPAQTSALVLSRPGQGKQTSTLQLAQRIIKNAFNFLASFSGNLDGGVEVVPLKAFEEWWRKFETRVRNDPGFLERDGD